MRRPSASRLLAGPDTEHMRIRHVLLRLLLAEVTPWNEHVVARALGISQQRANALRHGRSELFNSETLIEMLHRMGVRVDLVVTERRRPNIFGCP